jgi:hypothetical protein
LRVLAATFDIESGENEEDFSSTMGEVEVGPVEGNKVDI